MAIDPRICLYTLKDVKRDFIEQADYSRYKERYDLVALCEAGEYDKIVEDAKLYYETDVHCSSYRRLLARAYSLRALAPIYRRIRAGEVSELTGSERSLMQSDLARAKDLHAQNDWVDYDITKIEKWDIGLMDEIVQVGVWVKLNRDLSPTIKQLQHDFSQRLNTLKSVSDQKAGEWYRYKANQNDYALIPDIERAYQNDPSNEELRQLLAAAHVWRVTTLFKYKEIWDYFEYTSPQPLTVVQKALARANELVPDTRYKAFDRLIEIGSVKSLNDSLWCKLMFSVFSLALATTVVLNFLDTQETLLGTIVICVSVGFGLWFTHLAKLPFSRQQTRKVKKRKDYLDYLCYIPLYLLVILTFGLVLILALMALGGGSDDEEEED